MTCPKCHGPMRQYERSGVTIDQCTECRGVFLDRGELEHLFEAEANWQRQRAPQAQGGYPPPPPPPHQPGAHVPPPPPAPGYPPQPAYGAQYGYHGHYRNKGYHGHYRNKRRKGFLGELFD